MNISYVENVQLMFWGFFGTLKQHWRAGQGDDTTLAVSYQQLPTAVKPGLLQLSVPKTSQLWWVKLDRVCSAGSIILAADGSLSLKVKSCGDDFVITEAEFFLMCSQLCWWTPTGDIIRKGMLSGHEWHRHGRKEEHEPSRREGWLARIAGA